MNNKNILKGIQENFPSGLVVFLVALPLCLAIAIASGAPPLSGVISGIIGGIVIGGISNSNISVSGPAAGLTAIVLASITDLGSFELFLCAGIIGGLIQLIIGFLRAGSISNYFPNNVIEGMLAGIGIIIILKQIPNALGFSDNNKFTQHLFDSGINMAYFTERLGAIHLGAIIITIVSIVVLLIWDNVPALNKIKLLPSALVAVTVGIALNEIFKITGANLAVDESRLVKLPTPQSFDEIKEMIKLPDFAGFANPKIWITGGTIAIVASIETLLCIEASDRLDNKKRITDTNLELKAQGIGNIISAFIGGLPITSVVVRSSANANAVLILVGYKLAKPATFKHFWHYGKFQFIPFLATVLAVVFLDLLKGVGVGLAISIFYILQGNMKRAYYLSREELENTDEFTLKLAEEVSFLNKAAIKKTLKNVTPNSKVTIDARNTSYITVDVLELIQDFTNIRAKEDNIEVILLGFKKEAIEYANGTKDSNINITHRRAI